MFLGYLPADTQIRIGRGSTNWEHMGGFESNAICIQQTQNATNPVFGTVGNDYFKYTCTVPRDGNIISFQSVNTATYAQMVICDLHVNGAVPA